MQQKVSSDAGMTLNLDYAAGADGANPAAVYQAGLRARDAIHADKVLIANLIHAKPEEIFFTSGGTESNNWALKGVAEALVAKGKRHIITTAIEHPSVLETCHYLEGGGFEVTYLPVNRWGQIDPHELEVSIRNDTGLVSIMGLNNEIGTYQCIKDLADIAHHYGLVFHSDCVQLFPHRGLDVQEAGVDLTSISGHKFGAPVGVGILYVREGTPILPLIHGGGQQQGFRSGTESAELSHAFATHMANATAFHTSDAHHYQYSAAVALYNAIRVQFPMAHLNGAPFGTREPSIISICFPGVDGETLAQALSGEGFLVSRGSACSAGENHPSHVLKAIGLSDEQALSSIRISLPPTMTISLADEVGRHIGITASVLEDMGG